MANTRRELMQVRNVLLCVSGVAWATLLLWPGTSSHCPAMVSGSMSWREPLQMLKALNPLASLAAGWFLMLAAMMAPMLIPPVHHVRIQSFKHRRVRSMTLFLAAYFGIWLAAGVVLMSTELQAASLIPPVYVSVAGVAIALTWQFSPIKQHCLNRGHGHPPLPAFGLAADYAAIDFGLVHGISCVGSCWALMLFPILLPRGHVAAMAAVSFLVFSERLDKPDSPRWSCRLSGKLIRLIIAQTRMRLTAF